MKRYVKSNAYVDEYEESVDYLMDETNLPKDAAEFAIEYILDSMDLDEIKSSGIAAYFSWEPSREDADWADEEYDTIYEDAAFDGVIVMTEGPQNYSW